VKVAPTGELRQRQPRERNEAHLRFVRSLPCAVPSCRRAPRSQAAHIRAGSLAHGKRHTGKGEKPSDRWTLPLCAACHAKQHSGNELAFWRSYRIEPFELATALFECSGDRDAALIILKSPQYVGRIGWSGYLPW
jgi:hypothetical protein